MRQGNAGRCSHGGYPRHGSITSRRKAVDGPRQPGDPREPERERGVHPIAHEFALCIPSELGALWNCHNGGDRGRSSADRPRLRRTAGDRGRPRVEVRIERRIGREGLLGTGPSSREAAWARIEPPASCRTLESICFQTGHGFTHGSLLWRLTSPRPCLWLVSAGAAEKWHATDREHEKSDDSQRRRARRPGG